MTYLLAFLSLASAPAGAAEPLWRIDSCMSESECTSVVATASTLTSISLAVVRGGAPVGSVRVSGVPITDGGFTLQVDLQDSEGNRVGGGQARVGTRADSGVANFTQENFSGAAALNVTIQLLKSQAKLPGQRAQ